MHRPPARPDLSGRSPATLAALGGVLAALVGSAAGQLVAAVTDPASAPVLAVGSTVIDLTPTPVKEWAVSHFGTHDKTILVGSVLVGTLVLAAIAGLIARRRFVRGAALLVLLVAMAGAAAVRRPTGSAADLVPAVVTAIVGVVALWLLRRAADRAGRPTGTDATEPAQSAPAPNRRVFLVGAGVTVVLAAGLAGAGRAISVARSRLSDIVLPRAAKPLPPLPAGLERQYPGISALATPNREFYRVDTNLTVPVVDQGGWSLVVDGDVARRIELSYDDLLGMPLVEHGITLTCVSNEVGGQYVGAARWLGVPLAALMDRAGVDTGNLPSRGQLLSTAVDGFTISTPLDVALDGRDTMIAVGMNGAALPREHGFPARLVTPGVYGFVGATKWLTRLTLTSYGEHRAYWTRRGWATQAPIKISSRIDTPSPLSRIKPGDHVIGGVAWAQEHGIARVEVSIDGGAWRTARLGPDVGIDYWRQWYLPWHAAPGQHELAVRATSADGVVQTPVRATPFPAGSSGIQKIVVTAA
ncbi:molybdopterin-dependent oxidoreductase [Nocardioides terrisoli]|uniref:molybdopterin-dependent oxidoreductase n=1 Tax=Nocardioides terrisoli TaxID=3388267 RepID=UPI00287BBAF4|nr:molybdopterin-dependent oxidoreductase [Nocardioides marmorisolisilvae]